MLMYLVIFVRLHVQLMELQQKQINELADWLTVAEQKINSSETIGSDLDTVRRQVEDHKVVITLTCLYDIICIKINSTTWL